MFNRDQVRELKDAGYLISEKQAKHRVVRYSPDPMEHKQIDHDLREARTWADVIGVLDHVY